MSKSSFLKLFVSVLFIASLILCAMAWRGLQNTYVIIEWSTASELDTAGFNLYRSDKLDSEYILINSNLIPASSDPLTGGEYSYKDSDVIPGQTYFYELEDLEFNGGVNRYGPIEIAAVSGGKIELVLAIGLAGMGILILSVVRSRKLTKANDKY